MVERGWDTIVLGDGPVGLTTALIAARYGRVLVVLPRSASPVGKFRVDCVPAALLALFIELGLHPKQLGASSVFNHRLVAWSETTPKIVRGAGTIHLLRPVLEHCLLQRARTQQAISFAFDLSLDALPKTSRILDATGRRAATASSSHSPQNPALLRALIVRGTFSRAQQAFRLACLPTGYAYRLGTQDYLMLGLVQGKQQWRESVGGIADQICSAGAEWLLAGIPDAGDGGGIGGVASVQWASATGPAVAIGDASFARDALASQGIANGISGGLSLLEDRGGNRSYCRRIRGEVLSHTATLQRLVHSCVHSRHPYWQGYADFLARLESDFLTNGVTQGGTGPG